MSPSNVSLSISFCKGILIYGAVQNCCSWCFLKGQNSLEGTDLDHKSSTCSQFSVSFCNMYWMRFSIILVKMHWHSWKRQGLAGQHMLLQKSSWDSSVLQVYSSTSKLPLHLCKWAYQRVLIRPHTITYTGFWTCLLFNFYVYNNTHFHCVMICLSCIWTQRHPQDEVNINPLVHCMVLSGICKCNIVLWCLIGFPK